MGRSVSVPRGAQWTLYFEFAPEIVGEDGGTVIYDDNPAMFSDLQNMEWQDMLVNLRDDVKDKFPDFQHCDRWLDREDHAILESALGYLVLCEYMGLCSLSYVVKDTVENAELAKDKGDQLETHLKHTYDQIRLTAFMSNGEGIYQRAPEPDAHLKVLRKYAQLSGVLPGGGA